MSLITKVAKADRDARWAQAEELERFVSNEKRAARKAARVDTSVLFERLRKKAEGRGFVVFEIYVRNAGIGIAYTTVQGRKPQPGEVTVYVYKKNLRAAVEYELRAWAGQERV